MKKFISNLDKSVMDNSRVSQSEGLWRSEHSPNSYDLWGGDVPNELLSQIFYWPLPVDLNLPLWPYYYIENRRCDRQWFRHFNTPNLSITLVLEGNIEYAEDSDVSVVGPGEVMLQLPGSSHRMINADDQPTHKLVLLFNGWGKHLFSNVPDFNHSGKLLLKNSSVIEKKMRELGKLIKQKREGSEFLASEKAYSLWLELLKQKISRPLSDTMSKICQYMEKKNYIIENLETLANEAGVSHSTLLRLFQKHFKTAPRAFLNAKRLERGLALLNTGHNVKETAQLCGFNDAGHFSRAFKQKFGVSPAFCKKD